MQRAVWIIICIAQAVRGYTGCIPMDWIASTADPLAPSRENYCDLGSDGWKGVSHGWLSGGTWDLTNCLAPGNPSQSCGCQIATESELNCQCLMSKATYHCVDTDMFFDYCFTDPPVPCPNNSLPGTYNSGCGCKCAAMISDSYVYSYAYQSDQEVQTESHRWECTNGTTRQCPLGYQCPGNTLAPIPCADGYYQNLTGQSTCRQCLPNPGQYTPADTILCNKTTGANPPLPICDQCTGTAFTAQAKMSNCPKYDPTYRYDSTGACLKCSQCVEYTPNQQVQSTPGLLPMYYFVTDQYGSKTSCVWPSETLAASCTITHLDHLTQLPLNGNIPPPGNPHGMPFVPGYRRIAGTFANDPTSVDQPAYYFPCPTEEPWPGSVLRPILHSALQVNDCIKGNSGNDDSTGGCIHDCDPGYSLQCLPGYYAVLRPPTNATTPVTSVVLDKCMPCPPSANSSGGFSTLCTCGDGYAHLADIQGVVPQAYSIQAATSCSNCATDFLISLNSEPYAVRPVVCKTDPTTGTRIIQVCQDNEKYDSVRQACVSCGNGSYIANYDFTKCQACEPGYMCLNGTRALCDPANQQFQPNAGQSFCYTKAASCPGGNQVLHIDTTSTANNTCAPCAVSCPGDSSMIFASGHNDSVNPCGVKDTDKRYYACSPPDEVSFFSNTPNVRFVYVPPYDGYSDPTVEAEVCNSSLLPPNSDWATWPLDATTSLYGKQCYFACKYGVQAQKATILRAAIENVSRTNRSDLSPFLISSSSMGSIVYQSSVNVMSVFGVDSIPTKWDTTHTWQLPTPRSLDAGSRDAVTRQIALYNTFLFIDDLMVRPGAYLGKGVNSTYWNDLCMPAASLTTMASACTLGFVPITQPQPCAMDARDNLYIVQNRGDIPRYQYAVVTGLTPECWSSSPPLSATNAANVLSSFYFGCTHCTDVLFSEIDAVYEADDETDLTLTESIAIVRKWRMAVTWSNYVQQYSTLGASGTPYIPYVFNSKTDCHDFTCRYLPTSTAMDKTWVYSVTVGSSTYAACIPCIPDASQPVCAAGGDQRVFNQDACAGSNITTYNEVCVPCPNRSHTTGFFTKYSSTGNEYSLWLSAVSPNSDSSPWNQITCIYRCAQGFTPNTDPASYSNQPCLPCSGIDLSSKCSCQTVSSPGCAAVYTLSAGNIPSQVCGNPNNLGVAYTWTPYTPACYSCSSLLSSSQGSSGITFMPTTQVYTSPNLCNAMCNPAQYLTVLTSQGQTPTFTRSWTPQNEIASCVLCSDYREYAALCNGTCYSGWYLQNTQCVQCTNASCARLLCNSTSCTYRQVCNGTGGHDAACVPCNNLGLYNNPAASNYAPANSALFNAVTNEKDAITRRWVSCENATNGTLLLRVRHPDGGFCCAACVNNYVLIDLRTGLRPWANATSTSAGGYSFVYDSVYMVCIACQSVYVLNGVQDSKTTLYSVWNQGPGPYVLSPIVAKGVLSDMLSPAAPPLGACYSCMQYRATTPDVDVLCDLSSGYGTGSSDTTLVGISGSDGKLPTTPQVTVGSTYDGGRRLLQVNATSSPIGSFQLRVYAQPIVQGSETSFFTCCVNSSSRNGSSSSANTCIQLEVEQYEASKLRTGVSYGDYCQSSLAAIAVTPPTGNLTYEQRFQSCPAGKFKEIGGEMECSTCPLGASTIEPWQGMTSLMHCACLPGFYATRDPLTGLLVSCTACGANRYRTQGMPEDTCLDCPPNTRTASGIMANFACYCNPGLVKLESNAATYWACGPCPPGKYCDGGVATDCPANSFTRDNGTATSRGDCMCKAGYYGDLSDPLQECQVSPPALTCQNSGCTCAAGWSSHYTTDTTVQPSIVRQFCTPNCVPGEYATVDMDTFVSQGCTPCPPNTYSGSGAVLYTPALPLWQQCTACPVHYVTNGPGKTSRDDCVCGGYLSSDTQECGGCPADTYLVMDNSTGAVQCMACPDGMHAAPGSVSVLACTCPAGNYATRSSAAEAFKCVPCPVGTYSSRIGSACTPCPVGSTTTATGQTSLRACICSSNGFPAWNGACPLSLG